MTACAWVCGEANSFGVVSDYQSHDKYFTLAALIKILSHLLVKYPEGRNIEFYSDGAAQNFKQRFFLKAVSMIGGILGLYNSFKFLYNFFATSHGKGSVDGIGRKKLKTARR